MGIAAVLCTARGDINVNFDSTSSTATSTLWNYTINVTSQQEVRPGNFFTIYDFGDIIPASNVQPTGWTFATSPLGATPDKINAPDSVTLMNLTWTYNGPVIPTETLGLGPFQVAIAGAGRTDFRSSYFSGQGTLISGPNAGTPIGNIAFIVVPTAVPEPASIALFLGTAGLGLLGSALARRRKA